MAKIDFFSFYKLEQFQNWYSYILLWDHTIKFNELSYYASSLPFSLAAYLKIYGVSSSSDIVFFDFFSSLGFYGFVISNNPLSSARFSLFLSPKLLFRFLYFFMFCTILCHRVSSDRQHMQIRLSSFGFMFSNLSSYYFRSLVFSSFFIPYWTVSFFFYFVPKVIDYKYVSSLFGFCRSYSAKKVYLSSVL